jgi:hypothetical protein
MKKLILSIVLVSYLVISTGITVNLHYCMGQLDSAHIFGGKSDTCDKCGMHIENSMGCCRDEQQLIKMDDDQKTNAVFVFSLPPLEAESYTPSSYLTSIFFNTPGLDFPSDHSPPILSGSQIYLKNGVFRI